MPHSYHHKGGTHSAARHSGRASLRSRRAGAWVSNQPSATNKQSPLISLTFQTIDLE